MKYFSVRKSIVNNSNRIIMKKSFLLIAAGLMLTGSAMAQKDKKKASKEATPVMAAPAINTVVAGQQPETKTPAGGAEALWMKEATHDFGKIPQGKPVTTEFDFKNSSKDSLKLENVQAGCGCTTPVWKAGSYAPGENFKITVGYNAAAEGAFNKPVTLTYNGGTQKVIYITGTVYSTPSTPAPENKGVSKVQD